MTRSPANTRPGSGLSGPSQPNLGLPGPHSGLATGLVAGPVAGIDEAGRGCLAGPVVAAACILPEAFDLPGLTDSKALTPARRETLAQAIRTQAVAWSLGLAWGPEIDRVNILQATLRAMERAVSTLRLTPALLLIDGNQLTTLSLPQRFIIGGDLLVPAISAASILAKTFRDQLMAKLHRRHPGYNLAGHKGYGTAEHLAALQSLGPSPIHRLTFRGVRQEPAAQKERQQCLPGILT